MLHAACDSRRGLTLLELVVALGILAILSTVAIRSLEPVADQARYEVTQQVLNDLRMAVVGSSGCGVPRPQTSSQAAHCGFILDTGTLPTAVEELLVCPPGLIGRSIQTFDSDRDLVDDVSLVSGWNGPYLRPGAGLTGIVDGWGAEPVFVIDANDLEIASFGSDGDSTLPEDGYRKDISVAVSQDDYVGSLVLRVFAIDPQNGSRVDPTPTGTEQIGILFYGVNADGGTSGSIEEHFLPIDTAGSFEYRRHDTLIGPAAARAILWDDTSGDQILDPGETILKKSFVHYMNVDPRMDTRVEMELR